jgi:prolyl 4-hydroxylase
MTRVPVQRLFALFLLGSLLSLAVLPVLTRVEKWSAEDSETEYIEDSKRFPGWRGTLPKSIRATVSVSNDIARPDASFSPPGLSAGFKKSGGDTVLWTGRIEQISWAPRAYILHNFLTDEECDHLIALGNPTLVKSTVVDSKTGGSVDSDVRTSSGTFLRYAQDDIVSRIEERIAHVTMLPYENGESLQILKYVNGQEYKPHTDYFHDKVNADPSHGGQRIATVLMYLSTPEEGGETVFPYADGDPVTGDEWSECAKEGLAVKAVKGNALFFYGLKPDGTGDAKSTHGSCPTLKGEKYSATKWIHVGKFHSGGISVQSMAKGCTDDHELCGEWYVVPYCVCMGAVSLLAECCIMRVSSCHGRLECILECCIDRGTPRGVIAPLTRTARTPQG